MDLNSQNIPKKQNRIRYDPILTFVVIILSFFLIGSFVYLGILIVPLITQMQVLLTTTIPNEIEFYHQIIAQHNHTLVIFENQIENHLINNSTLSHIKSLVVHIDQFSGKINITQIQYDLGQIVSLLQHVIKM